MKSTHVGRLCWLSNLLKSAGGLRMLKDATDAGRRQRYRTLPTCGVNNATTIRSASLSGRIRKAACAFTTTRWKDGEHTGQCTAPPGSGSGVERAEWKMGGVVSYKL